jgi:hypothetical protein
VTLLERVAVRFVELHCCRKDVIWACAKGVLGLSTFCLLVDQIGLKGECALFIRVGSLLALFMLWVRCTFVWLNLVQLSGDALPVVMV